MQEAEPVAKPLSECIGNEERHISEWAVEVPIIGKPLLLFGCTEDVECSNPLHESLVKNEFEKAPYVRRICPQCSIPVCEDCWTRLERYHDGVLSLRVSAMIITMVTLPVSSSEIR